MALFDRLKEKVNKVVDIDKLSEVASKTVDSVKREITKAVDPSAKEQERLEKEKVLQEQKENAINDFFSSINLDEEIDYIFSVLQASGSSSSNFEKFFAVFSIEYSSANSFPSYFNSLLIYFK